MRSHRCLFLLLLPAANASLVMVSRRAFVGVGAALVATGLDSQPVTAVDKAAARVAVWPALEYLEPIYELKLSLDALGAVAPSAARWPALKKRMDAFFGGGLLSEKNYYLGLAIQYTNQIKYDDLDLYVRADVDRRRQAFEETLAGLEDLKKALQPATPEAEVVLSSVVSAQQALARWLELVPADDVLAADRVFRASRAADTDKNGKVSATELQAMPAADRIIWEKRVALVGD